MALIYNYTNYREFLLDFYLEKKAVNTSFSYQVFANKAGFKSKSFIKLVIDGKKNLTPDSTKRLQKVLKLNSKSFAYFEDLISFNQAKTNKLKNYFFEKIMGYNKRNPSRLVMQREYEFYSKWYHNTIRELVTQINFKEDYTYLGKQLTPIISARQARESLQLLLDLKLIKKSKEKYVQTDALLTTGNEVLSQAVSNFHLQNLNLAGEAIDTVDSASRDISSLVLGLSDDGFSKIKSEIQTFRKKLLKIANSDTGQNSVYNVNFQFIPTAKASPKKGRSLV